MTENNYEELASWFLVDRIADELKQIRLCLTAIARAQIAQAQDAAIRTWGVGAELALENLYALVPLPKSGTEQEAQP